MDPKVKAALEAAHQRLQDVDSKGWTQVEGWAAAIRPLFARSLRDHLPDFDAVTARPTWRQAMYVATISRSGRVSDNHGQAAARQKQENAHIAELAKKKVLTFLAGLLEYADYPASTSPHALTHIGDHITTSVNNSTVGSIASGRGSQAHGTASGGLTQEEHKALIKVAQDGLNEDQDALEAIDARLYEALGQFLRLARQIQVEQRDLAEVQAQMKETLDEVWAEQAAKGLKPKALPRTLEVVKALATSPLMDLAVAGLLSG